MKSLHIVVELILVLANLESFNGFSQRPVFSPVPQPELGAAYLITQDVKGYMWFGGIGLHRYDGYSYKSYFSDGRDSSLAGDKIDAICADHKGFIWVATTYSGLDRLDPETGVFTHYRHSRDNRNSISSDMSASHKSGPFWIRDFWFLVFKGNGLYKCCRRQKTERCMGSFLVVILAPLFCQFSHFFEAIEQVGVQELSPD
jgi:ligand-binding sensor domain-containing protein